MDIDWILVEDFDGLRTELLDNGTRMHLGGVGGYNVATPHPRTEIHDTDGPRRTMMANDAYGLLGTTHEMAPTTLRIRVHDYV